MDEIPVAPLPRRAAWRVLLEPAIRHIGWFGFFLVLAPIIGPRDYGIYVMALSGIAIVTALLGESTAMALLRLGSLDERHLSTALASAVGVGAAVSLVLYAAAGQFDRMLDDAPLRDIFQSLSLLPVLGGLSAVPAAVLRRRGRPGPFIAATTAGLTAGGGIALALAWAGAGPWALVAQIVVQKFVECVVLWSIAGCRIGIAWSRPHFAALVGALDLRALTPTWPVVSNQAPCLLIGLILGPVAAGLYMLAARFAEALSDVLLTALPPARRALLPSWADDIAAPLRRVALPAILMSALLAIALPPLVDIRWWGAVLPARILLLAMIPAAAIAARAAAVGSWNEARWLAIQTIGGIAVIAVAAPYGLTVIAGAAFGYATLAALASLVPIRRELGPYWQRAVATAARPLVAAAAVGLILLPLAEPVSLILAPLPALCLLGALGRLCYLLARGEPPGAHQPDLAFRRWFRPVKPA